MAISEYLLVYKGKRISCIDSRPDPFEQSFRASPIHIYIHRSGTRRNIDFDLDMVSLWSPVAASRIKLTLRKPTTR